MTAKLLKVNMIFGGTFHRFGTVLDENKVPPNLRKAKYLGDPNDTALFDKYLKEEPPEEFETDDAVADEWDVDEEPATPPSATIPSGSRARHFKPKSKR